MMSSESRHTGPFIAPNPTRGSHGIAFDHISFAYPTTAVFRDLCFSTEDRFTVLRGPSGCGKTTLLKLLSSFLKPASGLIQPEFRMPVLISQEDALFPWLTGLQNIMKVSGVALEDLRRSPLYSSTSVR